LCTLPSTGAVNQGIAGVGADARFGPEGSPFAGRFFAVTAYNSTIYQVTADGQCTPFITFDAQRFGAPTGIGFSSDGQMMLVTVARGEIMGPSLNQAGALVRVSADGKVTDEPLVRGLTRPAGVAVAPQAFGSYAGQVFVTDIGNVQAPVPMTQPLSPDGKLYRVTPDGALHLVASGFFNPVSVCFIGDTLWVSDINGDFIGGKRELPDGFIVEIRAQ
jgi:sugar lactone lactonase YvrE